MSAVGFFTPVYSADYQSVRGVAQNFVEGYFDLTSGLTLATALKVASYATLIIPAAVLVIEAYLRYSEPALIGATALQNAHNSRAVISFCENHPVFSGLLQKVQNLVHFENIGFRNGVNSRDFCIGSDINGQHKIFIKSPNGKHVFTRQLRAKNEQLAFLEEGLKAEQGDRKEHLAS